MLKTKSFGFLLGAALIANGGSAALAQEAAADAAAKASAASAASATVEKAGKQTAAAAQSSADAQASSAESLEVQRGLASLKSGTAVSAELDKSIDARAAKPGDTVSARVTRDVRREGRTVIRKGDRLLGQVGSAKAGASGRAGSELGVTFDRLKRGDAEYQLNTVVSSIISTPGNMGGAHEMSMMDEPIIQSGPAPSGGGGRSLGGGGLVGGATSTIGSGVSAAGSAVGGLAGDVGGTTSSALGSTGAAVGASGHNSAHGESGLGLSTPMRDIRLNSETSASQSGQTSTLLGARRGNLRLESGTRMQFKVSNQTEVEVPKK